MFFGDIRPPWFHRYRSEARLTSGLVATCGSCTVGEFVESRNSAAVRSVSHAMRSWPVSLCNRNAQHDHNERKAAESEQPSPTPAVRVQYREGQNDEQQEN